MNLTVEQWHHRFEQQASWSTSLRKYLYAQIGIRPNCRILDAGCGTGALSSDFNDLPDISLFGLDLNFDRLSFAHHNDSSTHYLCANAKVLPWRDESFDFVICHYFLLWLKEPFTVLKELVRVTKPGGVILAIAEPDYSSRIDAPDTLIELGKLQTQSLQLQGANPVIGRALPALFSQVGLSNIQFGVSGFQSHPGELPAEWEGEWRMLEQDLACLKDNEITQYKQMDQTAWLEGSRVFWVPTFYTFGTKS